MANPAGIDQLTALVNGLTLDSIAEKYPQAHPEINPLDLYRAHLSNVLAGISGVDPQIVYPAINWTTGLDKGDFVLAVPALRIKGQKPDALATKWAEEVHDSSLGYSMF
jgi:arginyl-tRNA synthetase